MIYKGSIHSLIGLLAFVLLAQASAQDGPYAPPKANNPYDTTAEDAVGLQAKAISAFIDQKLSRSLFELQRELEVRQYRYGKVMRRYNRLARIRIHSSPKSGALGRLLHRVDLSAIKLGQQVNLVKGVVMRTKAISAASTAASGLELAGEVLALRRQLDRLKSADTTTRKGVFELQQAMDKIQANNDAFTVDRFIMRLAVNCMPLPNPKHALITCGGLALRDFTHAWVNYSIPNALVEKKLEESAATISTRIRASAEQGRNDALAGRARDSGVIQQSEAYTVQQLGRKIGRVIRQLEDQSFIGKIISWFKYRNLLGAARKLQVDLSRGSNSEIMRQFQAAYEEAYDTTLLEKEIEEQAQAVREIQRRIVVLGDELEHLGLLIRRLQQEIERALEEPPEESSSDEDCDSSMPGQKLEQSLPDNLELAGNCGLLNRQPTINEFLMACQASEKQKTHTCTIVYCNHVFFHMGKQDVIECINDIRDQKRSAEEKERGWPNS